MWSFSLLLGNTNFSLGFRPPITNGLPLLFECFFFKAMIHLKTVVQMALPHNCIFMELGFIQPISFLFVLFFSPYFPSKNEVTLYRLGVPALKVSGVNAIYYRLCHAYRSLLWWWPCLKWLITNQISPRHGCTGVSSGGTAHNSIYEGMPVFVKQCKY